MLKRLQGVIKVAKKAIASQQHDQEILPDLDGHEVDDIRQDCMDLFQETGTRTATDMVNQQMSQFLVSSMNSPAMVDHSGMWDEIDALGVDADGLANWQMLIPMG